MSDTRYHNNQLIINSSETAPGEITWSSPSNLALIKYWGKFGDQLPRNPSFSLTLDQAVTEMTIEWKPANSQDRSIHAELFFHMIKNEEFGDRINKILEKLTPIFPFLHQLELTINTTNSFPHSSGIASSASSMSALALCLCSMEHEFFGTLESDDLFDQKASYVARLASGSACRSVFPGAAMWGEMPAVPGSSNLFAIPMADKLHDVFKDLQNAILVVSSNTKSVSSSEGHGLMNENPYAEARYAQATQRFQQLLPALQSGDIERAGSIIEQEALTLHALMMTSNPGYLLLEPNTLNLIRKIHDFRMDTGIQTYFSMDAGPNIHLLYPSADKEKVMDFIITELSLLCQDGMFIDDCVGDGPEQI